MIVILGRILFLITLGLIAGCTPALGDRGVGQDLYSSQTPRATNNIAAYFGELCNQTNLQRSGTAADCSDYSMLVQAGFNDIDARCDHYLAWIDNKRVEAGRVHSSLVAIGSAATSVLTIASASTDTIAYVAQALGLTGSLYDAFNNSLLMGLESSTIKRIVYERRLEFRRQFMQVTFSKSPEMVFALRGYLRICTPQTIVLDANTYALAAASGIAPQSLADSIQQEVDAISAFKSGKGPATAGMQADQKPSRGKVSCKECDKIFPKESGYTEAEIKLVQRAICVPEDGKPGSDTLAGIQNYRDTQGSRNTGPLQRAEFEFLATSGCRSGDPEKGVKNFYEAVVMRDNPNRLSDLIDDLNAVIKKLPALDKATVTLNTPELRDRIADARNLYGMQATTTNQNRSLSAELVKKLATAAAQ
ncbi:hypothetical protein [Rhizobium sp. SL42]|uniref:hypothetical protein n=1 Tax=Rhizobium sp. SL42 TaxID=2806346 RepID=UPI001F43240E|nr:hypothetical protein [Rhizobium sp. SL42]UJW76480.1 hypothetical protein IM739_08420 [Rhizobium sp. SL42]